MDLEISHLENPQERKSLVKYLSIFRKLRKISRIRAEKLFARAVKGDKEALIVSGQFIEPAEEKHLLALYKKVFDSPVKPTFQINPKLLGGVRMSYGDQMVELSLNQIKI
jgi:F-type H+-transporting ATPase subunit delta